MAADSADHVARLRAAWARERPDIDTEGMAILGRARRIVLASRAPIEAVFTRFDLDAGEFDVLASLRRSGAPFRLRPTELFQVLMISSGGLTDRLSRLERRGLIARIPCEEDRRSLIVELTETGRVLVEAAFEADMAVERGLLDGLSATERRDLAALLTKLAASIEAKAKR
jgi:DNA-binding MarR family transcriptional regulator